MAQVEFQTEGHIAIVTLNRPEARNAVNAEVAKGVEAALDQFEADQDLWVGILSASPPVFCAGADLKEVRAGRIDSLSTARGGFAGIVARQRTKAIIAAVDGPAMGGGTEIALACDLIVASTAAVFGVPEVKRGLVAAGGGLFRLPQRLPFNTALEMILTGDAIEAGRAYDLGMVNRLADPGGALDAARELATRIEANAPVAVRSSRRAALASAFGDDAAGWRSTQEAREAALASQDVSEGLNAFLEKRNPSWSGL